MKNLKNKAWIIEYFLFPILLFLLPFRHIAEGIDISDTGYTMAWFKYFGDNDYPWQYSICGANVIGKLITKLPMGNSWIGINFYCSLILSVFVLLVYFFLRKRINYIVTMVGLYMALMLCWCPQVILYNYLTYIGVCTGAMLLISGLQIGRDGNEKIQIALLICAGILLGWDVLVKFSNLTHMSLIVILWYEGLVHKDSLIDIAKKTFYCIVGYILGLTFSFVILQCTTKSGIGAYIDMIRWLGSVSSSQHEYSAIYMILSPYLDYFEAMKWAAPFIAIYLMFFGIENILDMKVQCDKYKSLQLLLRIGYIVTLIVALRIAYGKGMFGLDYNTYFAFVRPVSIFICLSIGLLIYCLISKNEKMTTTDRLLSLAAIVMILIIPLGSNNRGYHVFNSLFLIAPTVLWLIIKLSPKKFSTRTVLVLLMGVVLIQLTGFGAEFVFRDPEGAEKRDTKIENSDILIGMHTTPTKAYELQALVDLVEKRNIKQKTGIFYGDIAGLSFALDVPSSMSGIWVSLESYNWKMWNDEMGRLYYEGAGGKFPVIFIAKDYAVFPFDEEKRDSLDQFMREFSYKQIYEDGSISVYDVEDLL